MRTRAFSLNPTSTKKFLPFFDNFRSRNSREPFKNTPFFPSTAPANKKKEEQKKDPQKPWNPDLVNPYEEILFHIEAQQKIDLIEAKIEKLPKWQRPSISGKAAGGHSSSSEVYNPTFDKLQRLLINLSFWGKDEHEARLILVKYAKHRVAAKLGGEENIPPNVMYLLERIGLSEMNNQPIKNYNKKLNAERLRENKEPITLPRTGLDFMAPMGSVNWCWQAQTFAAKNSGMVLKKARSYTPGEQLKPGDILTIITKNSPSSGHVVAVIHHEGDQLQYVSGNAGGGKGSVRIDHTTIEQKPKGYYWGQANSYDRKMAQYRSNIHYATESCMATTNLSREACRRQALSSYTPPKPPSTPSKPDKPGVVWVINITPVERIKNNIPTKESNSAG